MINDVYFGPASEYAQHPDKRTYECTHECTQAHEYIPPRECLMGITTMEIPVICDPFFEGIGIYSHDFLKLVIDILKERKGQREFALIFRNCKCWNHSLLLDDHYNRVIHYENIISGQNSLEFSLNWHEICIMEMLIRCTESMKILIITELFNLMSIRPEFIKIMLLAKDELVSALPKETYTNSCVNHLHNKKKIFNKYGKLIDYICREPKSTERLILKKYIDSHDINFLSKVEFVIKNDIHKIFLNLTPRGLRWLDFALFNVKSCPLRSSRASSGWKFDGDLYTVNENGTQKNYMIVDSGILTAAYVPI